MFYIQAFDNFLLQKVINIQNPVLTSFMTFITYLGSTGMCWLSIGLLFLFYRKTREIGLILIVTIILGGLLNDLILKNIFTRQRPFDSISWVSALIPKPSSYSFPSGHAFSSFAAAYIIAQHSKKGGICAYILAALIAFSRVYLRVHYPTDIIAGAAFGTLFSVLLFIAYYHIKGLHKKRYG